MRELEGLLALVLAAVTLAAVARRVGAPYPVFLALGGALLAFLPGAPSLTVPAELALAIFVAPVLLDAAFDASPRDLKDNWAPVTGLVIFAGFTMYDFQRLRKTQDIRAAPVLAASIFIDVLNVFLLLLNLFNRD